ncbi:MAG: glucose-6-phosphate isomerase family protein [Bryobacteraceae bacterium]
MTGLDLHLDTRALTIGYGSGVFGPAVEVRRLEQIRATLRDPACAGPDPVYAIAMDVGKPEHLAELKARNLLFGAMVFAAGRLGSEPVRTQGHVHRASPVHGWSTPELYEIWSGRAIVLMQERANEDPGRCFAAEAGPGEHIVVPPGWAHATLSVDPDTPLSFGAWCDRDYGFEYDDLRRLGGLAWFAEWNAEGRLEWHPNSRYAQSRLISGHAIAPKTLGVEDDSPIYTQFERDPARFQWVSKPATMERFWAEI